MIMLMIFIIYFFINIYNVEYNKKEYNKNLDWYFINLSLCLNIIF